MNIICETISGHVRQWSWCTWWWPWGCWGWWWWWLTTGKSVWGFGLLWPQCENPCSQRWETKKTIPSSSSFFFLFLIFPPLPHVSSSSLKFFLILIILPLPRDVLPWLKFCVWHINWGPTAPNWGFKAEKIQIQIKKMTQLDVYDFKGKWNDQRKTWMMLNSFLHSTKFTSNGDQDKKTKSLQIELLSNRVIKRMWKILN